MQVKNITACIEIASRSRIHQTRRVVGLRPRSDFRGLELPPRLIERNPGGDARIVIQTIHYLLPFTAVSSLAFRRALFLDTVEIAAVLPFGAVVATGHILPNNDSFAVAIGIPCCRFNLDMLTDHIETPILCLVNIIDHSLIRGGRVKPVGPPALVERAELEQVFVVKLKANNAIGIPFCRELTHGGITLHFVYRFTVIVERHFKIVEIRRIGRPQFRTIRHGNHHRLTIDALA